MNMQRTRQTLRLSIESSPKDYRLLQPTNTSTPESGSPGSSTDSSTGNADWRICSVLCLHDYASDDPSHLSFARNEILEIVQQEDTGWWAALRLEENRVGWISSAFVEPLSHDLAERLRSIPEPLRALEYEMLYESHSAHIAEPIDPISPLSEVLAGHESSWLPNIEKTPATPSTTRFLRADEDYGLLSPAPYKEPTFDLPTTESETVFHLPKETSRRKALQHSPSAPIPRLRSEKPISPRPFSVPHELEPQAPEQRTQHHQEHTRSQSESSTAQPRHLRRRPLLLDDTSSLSRLSTLIESQNAAEVDMFVHSPLESVDAFSRLAVKSPFTQSHPTSARTPRPPLVRRDGANSGCASPAIGRSVSPRLDSSWFMRPSYDEDDMKLEYDGTVKAATLPALIERLTLDYLKSSEEMKFRHAFLMTYRTFSTADEVLDLIIERFNMESPPGLGIDEVEEWKEKKLRTTQHRILTLITVWIEDHSLVLEEPKVARRLKEFLVGIVEPAPLVLTASLMIQALHRSTHPAMQLLTPVTPSLSRRWRHKSPANDLLRMDPTELAQQFCLLEHRLYAKIRVQDCWAWKRTSSPLSDFCSTHDRLGTWVRKTVLKVEGARKKAEVMNFWVQVAEKCRAMNNISSMNAIVTALSSKLITSLDYLPKAAILNEMIQLGAPTNNFGAYKSLLQSINGPCVPFIGMYLVEIIEINDQFPDTISPSKGGFSASTLINFTKRFKWAEVVESMLRFQNKVYGYLEAQQMMNFIEANLGSQELDVDSRRKKSIDATLRALSDPEADLETPWRR